MLLYTAYLPSWEVEIEVRPRGWCGPARVICPEPESHCWILPSADIDKTLSSGVQATPQIASLWAASVSWNHSVRTRPSAHVLDIRPCSNTRDSVALLSLVKSANGMSAYHVSQRDTNRSRSAQPQFTKIRGVGARNCGCSSACAVNFIFSSHQR
jgi:hypothetical protein